MPHNVSTAFQDASEASTNDVNYDVLIGWDKDFDSNATFFELDVSTLDGPDFLKGSGDNVTFFDFFKLGSEKRFVEQWEVTRATSLFPYGLFMAQADLTLDNASKRFLPGFDNEIGDYIKPRRPMKIYSGFDNEIVSQFVGFTDIPKNSLVDCKTTIHAMDVMDYFDTVETDIKYFEQMYWHEVVEALLLEQGFISDQFELEESTQPKIGYMPTGGMTVGEIFRKGCEAEEATMFADEDGIIRLWNRFHYYNASMSPSKTLSYENVKDVRYEDTPIINYVRVLALPRAISALQKLWQSESAIEIEANSSRLIPINFEDDFGALPITSAHAPVYITDQDEDHKSFYLTNDNSQGTGNPNESAITMSDFSVVGDVAFIEFTNSDSIPMFITDLHIYGTPAKVTAPIEEEYKDQASIDAYGINPDNSGEIIEIENDWIQSKYTAFAHAFTMVEEYKEGNQQLQVEPFPDPSLMYGDIVEMTVDDVDSAPRTCIIVGTKLKNDLSQIIDQYLTLDERTFKNYFRLDVSELDGSDVLAA